MNLILFTPAEAAAPLPRTDPRAVHLLGVLDRHIGDTFDTGLVNGPRGKGTLVAIDDAGLTLSFTWNEPPPPLDPLTLLIGLPRPQTARDILRDATTLGVGAIHFVRTMRSDPNYASSSLWTSGEWRRHLITGAEQAFDTRIPTVTWTQTLDQALTTLPIDEIRLALDNYEASAPLACGHSANDHAPVTLAIGPERGWAAEDRDALRAAGFTLVHIGPRVLRTETAVVAALAILRAGTRPTFTPGLKA